jgi:Circadian oscillating protein COP23
MAVRIHRIRQRATMLVSTVLLLGYSASEVLAQINPSSPTSNDDVIVDTNPQPGRSPGNSIPDRRNPDRTIPTDTPGTTNLSGTRFSCASYNGQYTVMYQPQSQPGQAYPWAVPSVMGGGWDSTRRCNEISRRLEAYRADGLQEMQTAVENGYNTVCVTTQRIPSCRIVLTVPRGQDPQLTRDRVFQNLTVADSGQQTQGVNTFVEGNNQGGWLGDAARALGVNLPNLGQSNLGQSPSSANGINLRPFLDRADGGTGTYLTKAPAIRPGRRLNPNRFR